MNGKVFEVCFALLLLTKNKLISKEITVWQRGPVKTKAKGIEFQAFLISKLFYCHCILSSCSSIRLKECSMEIGSWSKNMALFLFFHICFPFLTAENTQMWQEKRTWTTLTHWVVCTMREIGYGRHHWQFCCLHPSTLSGIKHSTDRLRRLRRSASPLVGQSLC